VLVTLSSWVNAHAEVACLPTQAAPRPMSAAAAATVCKSIGEDDRREPRCERGEWRFCDDAARARVAGCHVVRDEKKAMAMVQRACDAGAARSCTYLGFMYERARSESDLAKAAALYRKACERGDVFGCTDLLGSGGRLEPTLLEHALEHLKRDCDQKHPTACHELGILYERGLGVARADQRAASLYQRSCDLKSADGCKSLGLMYALGKGVDRDRDRAKTLCQGACAEQVSAACDHLSVFALEQGDTARALTFAQQACDLEDAHGCANLGGFYMSGTGVVRDPGKASELFERACDDGDHLGCRFLAQTLHVREPARSAACMKLACDRGDAKACAMK
jgi:TPR repeat protein